MPLKIIQNNHYLQASIAARNSTTLVENEVTNRSQVSQA